MIRTATAMSARRIIPLMAAALVLVAGCKIIPTPTEEETAAAAAGGFNPDAMVSDIWEPKVLPYLRARAGSFAAVNALALSDAGAAGERYGNPKKQANAPWTYVASAEGTIVAVNTKSRAGSIDVDVDADGKADLRAQIGPALRGTALRDALDFVDFNSFTNQIDFAQYGKAFNTHANSAVLSLLPREGLEGHRAKLLGAYAPATGKDLPLMTPAEAKIGPAL